MEINILDNFQKESFMVMELTNGKMVVYIKDFFIKAKETEKVNGNLKMVMNFKDFIHKI